MSDASLCGIGTGFAWDHARKLAGLDRDSVTSEVHTATCAPLLELLDQVPPRCWALLLLATFASLRFGELAGLRRRDLDLEACTIRVTVATAETDDGRLIDHDPKSRAGRGTVAFPKEIGPELRWHVACFAQAGDDGLVFIGPQGGRLRRSNFRPIWTRARNALGMPQSHFHDYADVRVMPTSPRTSCSSGVKAWKLSA